MDRFADQASAMELDVSVPGTNGFLVRFDRRQQLQAAKLLQGALHNGVIGGSISSHMAEVMGK